MKFLAAAVAEMNDILRNRTIEFSKLAWNFCGFGNRIAYTEKCNLDCNYGFVL